MTDNQQTGDEPALGRQLVTHDVGLGKEKQLNHALAALDDDDPKVRDRAHDYLISMGNVRVTDFLLSEVTCQLHNHRRRAITALGRLREPRAVDPIVARFFGTDMDERPYDFYKDEQPDSRLSMIRALERIGDANAIHHLREMALGRRRIVEMETMGVTLRRAACAALQAANDTHAVDFLVERALAGEDTAISALGYLGDARAVPHLLAILEPLVEDTPLSERDEMFELGDLRSPIQITPERRRQNIWFPLPLSLSVFDIIQCINALGEIGDARAVDVLIKRLRKGSRLVSAAAAIALGRIGDVRAVEPILEQIKLHPRRGVGYNWQPSYAEALGSLRDPRAIDPLLKMLTHSTTTVQIVLALGEIGTERVVEPLIKILQNHTYIPMRKRAVEALSMIYTQYERVPAALIDALNANRHLEVRRDAATVLGQHREVRAVEALIKAFNEDRPKVQREAKLALKRIGTPEALAAIKGR